ncbi:MAG TPA: hypothetical protein VLL72_04425 [Kiloniellales bacterium]|nr:hypothetical protein [Kiloniellales bacterium]
MAERRRKTGSKPKPARSAEGLAESSVREARLAEALRANLARRKAQSRGRAEPRQAAASGTDAPDTAENGPARDSEREPGGRP